jgi:phenylpyruvate tautomerase PptA (4-oxalocrotonate tautomerase family)
MPYIQIELQRGLPPDTKKALLTEAVAVVNKAIGSSVAHINVALIELPPENIVEAGQVDRKHG